MPKIQALKAKPRYLNARRNLENLRLSLEYIVTCVFWLIRYTQFTMVVRMRHTRSHTGNRRSHHRIATVRVTKDESGTAHVRHRMNPTTGKYRGRMVTDVISIKAKKAAKQKAKASSVK